MQVSSLIFTHPTKLLLPLSLISFAESKWNQQNYRILTYKRELNAISIDPSCLPNPDENCGITLDGKKCYHF